MADTLEVKKKIFCARHGHSQIQTFCFNYFYCARCGVLVGDTLASTYPNATNVVIVGHNCKTCRKNYKKLTANDKKYTPNPFKKKQP